MSHSGSFLQVIVECRFQDAWDAMVSEGEIYITLSVYSHINFMLYLLDERVLCLLWC